MAPRSMSEGLTGISTRSRLLLGSAVKWVILLLCLGSLVLLTANRWRELRRKSRLLPISLVPRGTADYSAERSVMVLAPVGLGIVKDMIRDSQPESGDLSRRLTQVGALLQSHIPGEPPQAGSFSKSTRQQEAKVRAKESPVGPVKNLDNPGKPGTVDKPGEPAKPDKPDKPDQPDKPDKSDKSDKPDKSGKGSKG